MEFVYLLSGVVFGSVIASFYFSWKFQKKLTGKQIEFEEKQGKKNMIVQIGPYPPPIGGVSMHIKRMKERLDSNRIQNEVWDISRVKKNISNIKNILATMKAPHN